MLNSVTKKDSSPLPNITDTQDTLNGSNYFSSLDLASGYNQIPLDEGIERKQHLPSQEVILNFYLFAMV